MHKKRWKKIFYSWLVVGGIFFCGKEVLADISSIENLVVVGNISNISLEWQKPLLQETQSIIVLRKENSCPISAWDGLVVYQGNGKSFTDENANKSLGYCYAVYTLDSSGTCSGMKFSGLVKELNFKEYLWFIFQSNNFIFIGILLIFLLSWLNILKKKNFTYRK